MTSTNVRPQRTFRIWSAWDSHFALPSFSVIEPRSKKSWAITILATEAELLLVMLIDEDDAAVRSKAVLVGEFTLVCDNDGENVAFLEAPPPPLLPPPPPP